eukprot:3743498-Ditylum_brightwellii.AAC.1
MGYSLPAVTDVVLVIHSSAVSPSSSIVTPTCKRQIMRTFFDIASMHQSSIRFCCDSRFLFSNSMVQAQILIIKSGMKG